MYFACVNEIGRTLDNLQFDTRHQQSVAISGHARQQTTLYSLFLKRPSS